MTGLLVAAILLGGVLAGMSLDKVLVQLPTRQRLGAVGYAAYARAADLGNGLVVYPLVAIPAALVTIAAFVVSFAHGNSTTVRWLLGVAAALSVAHSASTGVAAPTLMKVRGSADTEAMLGPLLSRFARASAVRAGLQTASFVAVVAAGAVRGL